ncbi:hypothetical protein GHT09_009509 [Marmota monax]|uniref:Uncharacterized protein n=1 Tax=Marmota monax TaxID=9995 RepID=A0A834PPT2_MARMO|nr:hypothetical protein GHT09_009509 [Marmota monax]
MFLLSLVQGAVLLQLGSD